MVRLAYRLFHLLLVPEQLYLVRYLTHFSVCVNSLSQRRYQLIDKPERETQSGARAPLPQSTFQDQHDSVTVANIH